MSGMVSSRLQLGCSGLLVAGSWAKCAAEGLQALGFAPSYRCAVYTVEPYEVFWLDTSWQHVCKGVQDSLYEACSMNLNMAISHACSARTVSAVGSALMLTAISCQGPAAREVSEQTNITRQRSSRNEGHQCTHIFHSLLVVIMTSKPQSY